jgi:DNA/RNA-binding domain of Phe-tRNA-synthetase-like protein
MMSFVVTEECVRLGLWAGAVVFRNVRIGPAPVALRQAIAQEVRVVQERLAGPREVRATPQVTGFQEVLRRVGVNPRRDQPSVERLLTFALKRGDLPAVNSLVDTYNLVSIRWRCSLGAHDLDTIALPITLRLLTGRESFTPLGRNTAETVVAGEFGYVDAQERVLCRLDVLQADFSKVTAATVNALLIIEGTSAHTEAALRGAFADAVALVLQYCGGSAEVVAFPAASGWHRGAGDG